MSADPARIARMVAKLEELWQANPDLRLGQLLERVEDTAWDGLEALQQRHVSRRLMHLPDHWLETAINHHLPR